MSDNSPDSSVAPTGYEIVANLLSRQDQVLSDLEDLNQRIEATIKDISESRQSELEREPELSDSVEESLTKAA